MSVVDAPPGLDFAGAAAGEFRSRTRPRRLARFAFFVCLFDGVATFALAMRQFYNPGTTILMVGPLLCLSLAAVGLAVRSARVRVEREGLHWGWPGLGFRIAREELSAVGVYGGAVAIQRKRGTPWYLSRYDWDQFDELPKVLSDAGYSIEHCEGRVPLRARMQAYGVVLDGLMVMAVIGSALLLLFGALR
mgnify:CR=1 FL=1